MTRQQALLFFILLLTLVSLAVDLPKISVRGAVIGGHEIEIKMGKLHFRRDLKIKQGLDLRGGLRVILRAEMKDIEEGARDTALEAAKNVIERRVNFFGVTEPVVQTSKVSGEYRIIVELPGVTETEKALELIGQTAQLDFRELDQSKPPPKQDFKKTDLSGKDLEKAWVSFNQQTGAPQVSFKLNPEGGKKFSELTQRNLGKRLAIFLDEVLITAPVVQSVISEEGVITGEFKLDEAKRLAIQLNAGALPVPIKIIEQRHIGATLGQESIQKSLTAGLIGLFLVAFFMVAYYGRLGLIADVALIIYGLATLALYKLIPVTLTLAGIAGFILSIGMAVDANILIFERMKEERRAGKNLKAAMELGFGRAWDSIRDANICTLITCFILFNPLGWSFLNTSGMVRGFALTLGLGVLISLFTGVVVTRTLVRAILSS